MKLAFSKASETLSAVIAAKHNLGANHLNRDFVVASSAAENRNNQLYQFNNSRIGRNFCVFLLLVTPVVVDRLPETKLKFGQSFL